MKMNVKCTCGKIFTSNTEHAITCPRCSKKYNSEVVSKYYDSTNDDLIYLTGWMLLTTDIGNNSDNSNDTNSFSSSISDYSDNSSSSSSSD